MNKQEFLKSLTTPILIAWRDRAESVGGVYTHFDQKTNSSVNFSLDSINYELDRREDKPVHKPKKKK